MTIAQTNLLAGVGEDGRHLYTCPLCEAMCGLEIQVEDRQVTGIRGNRDDVWSRGHICPRAPAWAPSTMTPTGSAGR